MVDPTTQREIDTISYDLLKASKSWNVFPTPVDKIVSFSDLMYDKHIDVSQIHHGYTSKITDTLISALAKVRGLFDRSEKTIYIDQSLPDQKKRFVQLHEVGHGILSWQNQTIAFLDDDQTLDPNYAEQFEAEANYFASSTLFQCGIFDNEMDKLEFGIKSALALAKKFGGSGHATIRRYVEKSTCRCSLLVLKNISPRGQGASCQFRDYFQSASFTKEFGIIQWPKEFIGLTWEFVNDYYFGRKMKFGGEIEITTALGLVNFRYDFFDTTYNAFVLIYPNGEKTKGKIKVQFRVTS